MSATVEMKLRRLPDGAFHQAVELGWKGRMLEVDLADLDLPLGTLLEIERGSMIYLGELHQKSGSTARVMIEHSLDRAKLGPIRQLWG
jgi:hypothetical protein